MIPKFRAWDKEFNLMSVVTRLDYWSEIVEMSDGELYIQKLDKIELMQSTGIFEGDIVRVLDSTYTVFYDNERGIYRLKPHDDRWNVDYMSNFSHGGNFEVVGNIYENKELLNA